MAILLKQFTAKPNAGDAASAALVTHFTGEDVIAAGPEPCRAPNLMAIGSILEWADDESVVWGAGLLQDRAPMQTPRAVCAVRGRLTREALWRAGVDGGEALGDPAILAPRLRAAGSEPRQDIGLVPHYVDLDCAFVHRARAAGVIIIDPRQRLDDYLAQLLRCRAVVSSSLHGLIFAHAYAIPAVWMKLSDRVLGEGFKFRDYYSSIGFAPEATPCVGAEERLETVLSHCHLPLNPIDSEALLAALDQAMRLLRRS
jgi:pyruvyltransferase